MKGMIDKFWRIECGARGCGRDEQVPDIECHAGKSGAAGTFRMRGWSQRGGVWICPSHARLTPRGTEVVR